MSTAAREEAERWIKDHYEDRRREAARSGGIIARDTLAHDAFIAGNNTFDSVDGPRLTRPIKPPQATSGA